jgi:hypothetical protein
LLHMHMYGAAADWNGIKNGFRRENTKWICLNNG